MQVGCDQSTQHHKQQYANGRASGVGGPVPDAAISSDRYLGRFVESAVGQNRQPREEEMAAR